ncbi:MAG: peptidylprolyl isomerase [Proteobacteria bacterium]|nr:MAG: peptidylprolyl isomerase [Pseudomonadota bacterium]
MYSLRKLLAFFLVLAFPAATIAAPALISTPSGLQYSDLKVGEGTEAKDQMLVKLHYTSWAALNPTGEKGKRLSSSTELGQPISFMLGVGRAVEALDKGVPGMKVGGKRLLVAPANMAPLSPEQAKDLPPNSPVVFEIELLEALVPKS